MKNFACFVLVASIFSLRAVFAGMETQTISGAKPEGKVPIDIVDIETGYVFESDLNHGGSFGKQDEFQNEFEYAHRFQLSGNWYLRLGIGYNRYDFGKTAAPVPVHLQSGLAVIGVDYMHGADLGAFLHLRPGFYTEEHIGLASFDCPITLGRFWILQPHKLYVLTGAYASFLRGGYPVVPLVGVVWVPNDKVRLMGVLPEPRLIYSPNDKLDLWIGAEYTGGSFRTDHHNNFEGPHIEKLSGTQVDFTDYRTGVGLTYALTNAISLDGGGGCSIQRAFLFHRAGENYRTDPSPYVRIEIKARF